MDMIACTGPGGPIGANVKAKGPCSTVYYRHLGHYRHLGQNRFAATPLLLQLRFFAYYFIMYACTSTVILRENNCFCESVSCNYLGKWDKNSYHNNLSLIFAPLEWEFGGIFYTARWKFFLALNPTLIYLNLVKFKVRIYTFVKWV